MDSGFREQLPIFSVKMISVQITDLQIDKMNKIEEKEYLFFLVS